MRCMLLQACAALLACWGLKYIELAALLVIVAAQFGGIYRPRTAFLLLLAANLVFLASLFSWLRHRVDLDGDDRLRKSSGIRSRQRCPTRSKPLRRATSRCSPPQSCSPLASSFSKARAAKSACACRESCHDVVGHKLTALKLQLRLCMRDAAPPDARVPQRMHAALGRAPHRRARRRQHTARRGWHRPASIAGRAGARRSHDRT